jgi:hypothetical protein
MRRDESVAAMNDNRAGMRCWLWRSVRGGVVLAAAILAWLSAATLGAAQTAPGENKFNADLLKLAPDARAAKLAQYLGDFCIGTKPFAMGITKDGPAKGYAYWSLECAGGKSYAIQIAPDGKGAAIECSELKSQGEGRECYKTF